VTPTTVIEIGRQAVEISILISAPLFIAALVTGLLVSLAGLLLLVGRRPFARDLDSANGR